MEFDYKVMGNRIKQRRKEMKLTQSEFAEMLDISNNHASSIENGREKPSFDRFLNICKILNVTPDYLILGIMHTHDIPMEIIDNLRLCNARDVALARDFVELLVDRNRSQLS